MFLNLGPVLRVTALLTACVASMALAADNQLTDEEERAGWQLLFNGKDHAGWRCNNGKPIATPVEDGSLLPFKSGGYIIIYDRKQFSDFVFKCDVKWEAEHCNSGIFFRVEDPENPVHTGFEVQVMSGNEVGKHQFGAIYDLVPTKVNAGKKTGQWNTVEVTCRGPRITGPTQWPGSQFNRCRPIRQSPAIAPMARSTNTLSTASRVR